MSARPLRLGYDADTLLAAAARVLIGAAKIAENSQGARPEFLTMDAEVVLIAGGVETWRITVERTASSH
jgi:hypothetical protein